MLLPELGERGQERLRQGAALVVGVGALGSSIAEMLVRAGVGKLCLVDRDIIELSNLHRQILYTEEDAASRMPKALAAAKRLSQMNSEVELDARTLSVNPRNVESLIAGVDVVVDGTDNIETRYVMNDACVKHGKPWIYGGSVGTAGMTMTIVPGKGPCLRCLFPDAPPPGSLPTCDTMGVLGTAPVVVGALQATAAIKVLNGDESDAGKLLRLDVWRPNGFAVVEIPAQEECPACGNGVFDFLTGKDTSWVTSLCGRNAVQIAPACKTSINMEFVKDKIEKVGPVDYNGITLAFEAEGHEIVVFPDGRVIIKGTTDETLARGLYDKYVG